MPDPTASVTIQQKNSIHSLYGGMMGSDGCGCKL